MYISAADSLLSETFFGGYITSSLGQPQGFVTGLLYQICLKVAHSHANISPFSIYQIYSWVVVLVHVNNTCDMWFHIILI